MYKEREEIQTVRERYGLLTVFVLPQLVRWVIPGTEWKGQESLRSDMGPPSYPSGVSVLERFGMKSGIG